MMWKTFIFLAVTSVVLAGKINNKRNSSYEFHIKHDYDYLKHHDKLEHHKHEIEEKPEENHGEHKDDIKEKEHNEEVKDEPEKPNESDDSNSESQDSENNEGNKSRGYEFLYKVIDPYTHDIKGQHEKKYGGEVKGMYWLLQPDGYKRTVNYHADKHNDFQAKVEYSKTEEHNNEEENSKPKSEYFVKTYHESKKHTPIKEEEEEKENDKQEESAQFIPIYVIQ